MDLGCATGVTASRPAGRSPRSLARGWRGATESQKLPRRPNRAVQFGFPPALARLDEGALPPFLQPLLALRVGGAHRLLPLRILEALEGPGGRRGAPDDLCYEIELEGADSAQQRRENQCMGGGAVPGHRRTHRGPLRALARVEPWGKVARPATVCFCLTLI